MNPKWSRTIAYATRGAVSVAALAVGVTVFGLLESSRPEVARTSEGPQDRLVEVVVAHRVSAARLWEGFGTAEAVHVADVAAEVSALVKRRPVEIEPGRAVARGQLLIELENHDFVHEQQIAQQNMARFEAQLAVLDAEERNWSDQLLLSREEAEVAKSELAKAIEAMERDAGSQIEIDRRRRDYNASLRALRQIEESVEKIAPRRADLQASWLLERSRAAIADRNVARCVITSPIDGVLQDVRVHEGERVAAGTIVARVVNLSLIRVPMRLPQSAQASVRPGDPVELRADTLGWCWSGRVERLAPEADASTRTLTAFVEVSQEPQAESLLLPGRFLRAVVSSPAVERFVVPRAALTGDHVLLDVDGVVVRRPVIVEYHIRQSFHDLHPTEQEWVVLADASGLEQGDRVILSNVDELRPGERVLSIEPIAGEDVRSLGAGRLSPSVPRSTEP